MDTQPKRKPGQFIEIQKPKHSTSPLMQMVGEDNWSHFGNHERKDLKKKVEEQPRLNPVDPIKLKTKAGGQ